MSHYQLAVAQLRQALRNLMELPTPDDPGEIADTLGDLRRIEVLMAEWRRGLIAETPLAAGTRYRLKSSRKASRSYNIDRIIADTATALDTDVFHAIMRLRDADAMRFTVRWEDLKKAFQLWDIALTTTPHEIEDGDLEAPHVGEIWSDKTDIEAIKDKP